MCLDFARVLCVYLESFAPPCVSAFYFTFFFILFIALFVAIFTHFFATFFTLFFCDFFALGQNAKQVKLQKQNLFIFVDMR
ncbi:hypothetical protein CQA40_10635 [Helicobacter sp. MIT 01-3238]|nr:hypothetical protein CQA40_10635 [Helicobacter sp. MIT 01-3238]